MSRDTLIREVVDAVRRSQTANQTFDHTVAELLGINQTDMRCLDITQRRGQVTAGELARESGLTTGAVTAVVDRLERAGYAQRVRDRSDRRRVMVEVTPKLLELTEQYYGPLAKEAYKAFEGYTDEQLEVVRDFHRVGAEVNERMTTELREGTGREAT